jgi:RNA polymerase sigma-70 factor (ECF subfamily)
MVSAARAKTSRGAFEQAARECAPRIRAVLRRLVRTDADADDLLQETLLSAYRHWDRFRGDATACTWFHAIAVRKAARHGKMAARRRSVTEAYARAVPFMHPKLVHADVDPDSRAARELRSDARARVESAVDAVPQPYRTALVLKEIAGMSLGEVASVLGVREATVKTRVHRGRIFLRDALLRGRPTRSVPAPAYPRGTCMALLEAKMDSLDRGVPFPVQDELVCERCREVFASLDIGADACGSLRAPSMPAPVRRRIEQMIRAVRSPQAPRAGTARTSTAQSRRRSRRSA